ncbi:MAG: D-glycero-beta-D-manno-heptose 1-phosphate adenylyltransferase [Planctomycetota bacterium]|nr:D-glycero-beta-D-manno-heptose 1-phosphate adenylyltransferase [Planctomycetota bacterium]
MTRALPEVLASLGNPRVLVVGDIAVDRYKSGAVERISPEAPIPILRVEHEHEGLGCAGSVALIAAVLNAEVTLVGLAGEDAEGETLRRLTDEAGIVLRTVSEAGRRTSVKTRFLAHSHTTHQQVLRVDQESAQPLAPETREALLAIADDAIHEVDAVLLSDYGKGCLTPEVIAHLIAAARARGLPVIVDPKGTDFSRYRGATAITPNRPETLGATGIEVRTLDDAERAATELVTSLDLDFTLVTLDREGIYVRTRDAPGTHLPTTPREVFDVTGAGDMVLAALATALASRATPEEAAGLANAAAGIAVERIGVATVTRGELAARLALSAEGAQTKQIELLEARALGDRLRAKGKRIAFTNGCFDILHAGHVGFLQAAKAKGDVLVVGLNSDASVKRLKGPERPIQTADDRVRVLAALAAVDYVVVFEDDTPITLIESLLPHALVKGVDWKDKGVVGRDVVEANGGEVVLVDLLEGRSTTSVVDRIKGS